MRGQAQDLASAGSTGYGRRSHAGEGPNQVVRGRTRGPVAVPAVAGAATGPMKIHYYQRPGSACASTNPTAAGAKKYTSAVSQTGLAFDGTSCSSAAGAMDRSSRYPRPGACSASFR